MNAKTSHFFCRHDRNFCELFSARVVIDVGIHQENLTVRQYQSVHGCVCAHARTISDDLVNVVQMRQRCAPRSTNKAIHFAFEQHHGANQRQATTHINLGQLLGDAFSCSHLQIGLPKIAITMVLLDIDHLIVNAFF